MNSSERFKIVMDILDKSDFGNCFFYHMMFEKLKDDELFDNNKVNSVLQTIKEYENRIENNPNKFPEKIMRYLRQRRGLDEFDITKDQDINTLSQDEAFSEVCNWNGLLGGYDYNIKGWIKDIYNVQLGES
jgi:hypothetical protein